MRKKFTLLIISLALLLGSSIAWGQQGRGALLPEYQNEQVTPRRGDISNPTPNVNSIDTIHGPKDVNVVFGAGESSSIKDLKVNWPAAQTSSTLGGTLYAGDLLIGSDYSKNAVVSVYDKDGEVSGALKNIKIFHRHGINPDNGHDNNECANNPGCTWMTVNSPVYFPITTQIVYNASKDPGSPAGITAHAYNTSHPYAYPGTYDGIFYGSLFYPYKDGDSCRVGVYNHVSGELRFFAFGFDEAKTPYTSTKNTSNTDDGSSLLITSPGTLNQTGFQGVVNTTNYVRPTTVLVSGSNTLESMVIGNVEWYAACFNGTYTGTDAVGPFYAVSVANCGHYNGWMYYERDKNNFVWNYRLPSTKYVDAAVRLLDGADVCVKGDVKDNTSAPLTTSGTAGDNITDALLVLPGANGGTGRSNFRIKIGGNADMLHTQDVGAYSVSNPLTDGYLYSDGGGGPGQLFPRTQTSIKLSGGGSFLYEEVSGLNWTGYENLANNAGGDQTQWKPYASTKASVYGVGGLYNGGIDIHTRSVDNNDTTSIILIGGLTNNQDYFNIYSGGMLKNFRSECIGGCDSLVIGRGGFAPNFYLSNTMPLYIINDGTGNATTCCEAGIRFHTPGVSKLNTAITSALGSGDLHVQARGYMEINDDINFATVATKDNNVAFLSDQSYIKTRNFLYTAAGTDGNLGHLSVWAQGASKVVNASNCGGYVAMDNVSITSEQTANNWQTPFQYMNPKNHYNFEKLLNSGGCGINSPLAVYNTSVLDKGIQTRIQSENDSVRINGTFNYTGQDGSLFVQGERNVEFGGVATVDFRTKTGAGDAVVQSKNGAVNFFDDLQFVGNKVTDLMIDGEAGVSFLKGGTIDLTKEGTATAHVGIQSNAGNVLFDGAPFLFDMKNQGNIEVWAGRDIRIEDALTYNDQGTTPMNVHLYANYDILSNTTWTGAPVNFVVTNTTMDNTKTDWIAGRNIHTRDTVNFNYNSKVRDLTLKALGGNIELDRWTNISYDSDSTILLSAEMDCLTGRFNNTPDNITGNEGYDGSGANGNRNMLDGHIFLNDSFRITRTNQGAAETDLLAKYHIRTAMVTMDDVASAGNNTTIQSHMGDIFLGYSTEADGKTPPNQSTISYDLNRFVYNVSKDNTAGKLSILSGYDDQANANRDGGGNIYFTHIDATMEATGTHPSEISIPFSNEYFCGKTWTPGYLHERLTNSTMMNYEHAGIIGGVGRCGIEDTWADYEPSQGPGTGNPDAAADTSLIYRANLGNLLVDAGLRGNIIMNRGTYLDFQDDTADAFFLTRSGDIDMRGQTNIDNLQSSVLFLASSEEADKLKTGICDCKEQQNNVYLQDLQQRLLSSTKGSIFIGADNNIKLQYGGLKNVGTRIDPFLSENVGYNGIGCGTSYHCDADTTENKARDLILNFAAQSGQGGMGIVASDLIDIYKNTIYTGGNGPGMTAVPTYGTLHGESVAGYGLYIKSQGNKDNWTKTDFDVLGKCGRDCALEDCKDAFLHQTARVTFHADARIYAENQRVYIGSPVLDIYGYTELNTTQNKGSKTSIMIQTDSLIMHDSLILDGKLTKFSTWSNLYRDMPVFKFGHHRFTPPYSEDPEECPGCYTHIKTTGTKANRNALDSIFVTFRNGAYIQRLNTLVADHTVLSFLTDSFDHVKGDPVINAKFYTDTFKVRNHVELFKTPDHTRDGHFELISEEQMDSKDYAGIYARHLHMEPIQPGCSNKLYSQLWMQDPALDVITTSTFGGFGTIHADVHVEIEAKLAPGYASLGRAGRCYEQKAGTLSMQDLRLDKGAEIHYSIGDVVGFDGEYTDCIEVDELTLYGSVNIFVEKRACQNYEPGCYPIILYNSVAVAESNLNNLKLGTKKLDGNTLSLDTSTPGVVYLCVGENAIPSITREIYIPQTSGVNLVSPKEYGNHYIGSYGNFTFTVKFDSEPPLKVTTGRIIDGVEEELIGTKNANGEYVYVIRRVQQNITLTFGPDYATDNIEVVDGKAVWSYGNTIYIRVEKEDIASIYSVTGQLVKRIDVPESGASIPMDRGVYIVTLKDGSVHKVVLK